MEEGERRKLLLMVNQSGYFDEGWFRKKYALELRKSKLPPLVHFIMNGAQKDLDPGPRFSTAAYLKENPGVKDSKTIPLVHFLQKEALILDSSYRPSGLDLKKVYIRKSFQPKEISFKLFAELLEKTTVIIPTIFKKMELLEPLVRMLCLGVSEILIIDNRQGDEPAPDFNLPGNMKATVKIRKNQTPFNWSLLNNWGAAQASGEFLLFLNDDLKLLGNTEDLSHNGTVEDLKPLYETLLSPEIKIVAPLLLNPNGSVQSSGTYRTAFGITVAHATFQGLRLPVKTEALTGAFLLTRKETWKKNPFDEEQKILLGESLWCLQIGNNALDPRVKVVHFERSSRGEDPKDQEDFNAFIRKMPLQKESLYHSPLIEESKVKRVLFLKLDHIGDFSIALEVIRDFHCLYPNIPLDIACGPWNHALAVSSGLFSEVFDVEFFREFSQGGIQGVSKETQQVLEELLKRKHWTFVIDLRAHSETRVFFKLFLNSSAITVGYQSPYGTGDVTLAYRASRKTLGEEHNAVDLKWLMAAVPIFKDENLPRRNYRNKLLTFSVSASGPVKTWPLSNWKRLLELLAEEGFEAYQIGSLKDELLVSEDRDYREKTPLTELANLAKDLGSLHIGHDTGPTHLIAQSNHPVLEIVSGLVDPAEWQGRGPDVLSIFHKIHCTPCYDTRCPRNYRCLSELTPENVLLAVKRLLWLSY